MSLTGGARREIERIGTRRFPAAEGQGPQSVDHQWLATGAFRFIDELESAHGKPQELDGVWALTLGGGKTSSSDTLYFTAGPAGETHGLFGTITPVPDPSDND